MSIVQHIGTYALCWFVAGSIGWSVLTLRSGRRRIELPQITATVLLSGWTGVLLAIGWRAVRMYYHDAEGEWTEPVLEQIGVAILSGGSESGLSGLSAIFLNSVTKIMKRLLGDSE